MTSAIDENEDTRATDTVKGERHNTMDSEKEGIQGREGMKGRERS